MKVLFPLTARLLSMVGMRVVKRLLARHLCLRIAHAVFQIRETHGVLAAFWRASCSLERHRFVDLASGSAKEPDREMANSEMKIGIDGIASRREFHFAAGMRFGLVLAVSLCLW